MNTVTVRNIEIGVGIPKICVPIVGTDIDSIIEEARAIASLPADLVEWRVDWFEGSCDSSQVIQALKSLREVLGDMPLLFTFRTSAEGGEKSITPDDYCALNKLAAESGYVDLVDVEAFIGDAVAAEIIECAHASGVKVVASNHDFAKTPSREEIVSRLVKMQELGADIPKIAVMPNSKSDVLELLAATEEMNSRHSDTPVITMSMGSMGVISRLAGEAFGSALTFGAAKKASAPGQMNVQDLREVLEKIHKSM